MHAPLEPVFNQQGQIPAVVNVGMRQQHRLDLAGHNGQGIPVAQTQLLVALKQTAVHQQALLLVLDQVFGAGDRVSPAQKSDGGAHAPCWQAYKKGCLTQVKQP